jgi:hypothetical protein
LLSFLKVATETVLECVKQCPSSFKVQGRTSDIHSLYQVEFYLLFSAVPPPPPTPGVLITWDVLTSQDQTYTVSDVKERTSTQDVNIETTFGSRKARSEWGHHFRQVLNSYYLEVKNARSWEVADIDPRRCVE